MVASGTAAHRASDGRSTACDAAQDSAPSEDGVRFPYGENAEGRLVHISEVRVSGLACGCICPGCGAPLVAHRGTERVHHFQHHGNQACGGAWETALHKLAKVAVAEAGGIGLPEALASHGGRVRLVYPARFWECESVAQEVPMGDLVPDLVLRRAGRELLVEIEVTHACDEAKRAKLRERNLASVEVDLSRVPRHAPRAEHVAAILHGAPRAWIHNARVAEKEAELRAEAELHEAAVRRSRERSYGRIADEMLEAWKTAATAGHPSWHSLAPHAGIGDCVGDEMPGDRCFSVDARTWQSALLDFALIRLRWQRFSADAAVAQLHRLQMLKPPFWRREWEPGLVSIAVERMPGFRPPAEVVAEYADRLAERGVLKRSRKNWRADPAWAASVNANLQEARLAEERIGVLNQAIEAMCGSSRGDEIAEIRAWTTRPPEDGVPAPTELARAGGDAWEAMVKKLGTLVAMTRPGGEARPPGEFLGLPLERHRLDREVEAQAKEESRRNAIEEMKRADAERRRLETAEFIGSIQEWASDLIGPEAAKGWLDEAVLREADMSAGDSRSELSWRARQRIREAWDLEAHRIRAERAAERRKEAAREAAASEARRCQVLLEDAARRRFAGMTSAIAADDRADLWLRGRQRTLGRSPVEHCTDQRTLDECLDLLDPARKNGAGRR